jgi:predicted AlkP superfamily pyrophosphatase or phosphodiesterase
MTCGRRLAWAVLLGVLVLSCHGAAAPPPSAPPRRVLLLSLDGASAGTLHRLYREGKLTAGGFARFFREGQVADRLIPVDPALTSPNHISLATGYPAGRTGIVSNVFHPAGSPFPETVSGFAAPIATETLWEAARRQGKRVGINSWPGADSTGPRRRGDWGMAYTNTPDLPAVLVAAGGWEEAAKARGLASERISSLPPGRWADLPCRNRTAVCPVKPLGSGRIYFGAVYPLPAYPESFASALAGAGLFWPGPPDDDRLLDAWNGRPGLDLATWLEQSERFARFFGDGLLLAARRPGWDLLMAYMPVIDEAEHQLQLTDPRQPGFTPERRDELAAARARVWQEVDRQLARLLSAVDLRTTVVAVVSDHGMAPVHTLLRPNVLLRERGLLGDAWAVGDGGLVHVYLKPGRADLLPTVRGLLTGWKVGDEAPVERAFTRREAAEIQLDHPDSGDLILFLREGYMADQGSATGEAVSPTGVYGMHGYLSGHPEMHGIYLALGPGIPPGNAGTVRNLEVAGRVAGWLGIERPRPQVSPGTHIALSPSRKGG